MSSCDEVIDYSLKKSQVETFSQNSPPYEHESSSVSREGVKSPEVYELQREEECISPINLTIKNSGKSFHQKSPKPLGSACNVTNVPPTTTQTPENSFIPYDYMGVYGTPPLTVSPWLNLVARRRRGSSTSHTNSMENSLSHKRIKPVPEEQKDEAYWERRRKNNEAAKKSRDARRAKEDQVALRAAFLEQENLQLRAQLAVLKNEATKLQQLLLQRSKLCETAVNSAIQSK